MQVTSGDLRLTSGGFQLSVTTPSMEDLWRFQESLPSRAAYRTSDGGLAHGAGLVRAGRVGHLLPVRVGAGLHAIGLPVTTPACDGTPADSGVCACTIYDTAPAVAWLQAGVPVVQVSRWPLSRRRNNVYGDWCSDSYSKSAESNFKVSVFSLMVRSLFSSKPSGAEASTSTRISSFTPGVLARCANTSSATF